MLRQRCYSKEVNIKDLEITECPKLILTPQGAGLSLFIATDNLWPDTAEDVFHVNGISSRKNEDFGPA
jgi:hypothetical protein